MQPYMPSAGSRPGLDVDYRSHFEPQSFFPFGNPNIAPGMPPVAFDPRMRQQMPPPHLPNSWQFPPHSDASTMPHSSAVSQENRPQSQPFGSEYYSAFMPPPPYFGRPPPSFMMRPPLYPGPPSSAAAISSFGYESSYSLPDSARLPPPAFPYASSSTNSSSIQFSNSNADQSLHVELTDSNTTSNSVRTDPDSEWLASFQKRISSSAEAGTRVKVVQPLLSIPDARSVLKQCVTLRNELTAIKERLCDSETSDEEKALLWEQSETIKMQINEKREQLNEDVIAGLMQKLNRQRQRQARKKRHRVEGYARKLEAAKTRQEKHKKLDQWLLSLQEAEEEKKREKEMKAAADSTLGEVRRKLADATKGLEMLNLLVKLRDIRKERADQRGIAVPFDADENFQQRLDELTALLNRQVDIYSRERRTLEVMLETEQEETKEREMEEKRRLAEQRQQVAEQQLTEYLFGTPEEHHDPSDPMTPFCLYQEAASHCLEAFVEIRRQWDTFLVTETPASLAVGRGSHLPPGWVAPVKPSSTTWASALLDNQSS